MNRHKKQFRHRGRWTVSRQAVLDTFLNHRGHLSADDVFVRVRRRQPGIGIATVYRNLEFLNREGLLSRLHFGQGKAYYELNDDEREHHHHLVCTECGGITDYTEFIERELKLIKDLEKELSRKHNFDINSHQLHFYGVCPKCR